jgi:hypothetical protein
MNTSNPYELVEEALASKEPSRVEGIIGYGSLASVVKILNNEISNHEAERRSDWGELH